MVLTGGDCFECECVFCGLSFGDADDEFMVDVPQYVVFFFCVVGDVGGKELVFSKGLVNVYDFGRERFFHGFMAFF